MEWLNLKTSFLHSAEYIGSDPRSRATWLNVCLWCAQQENGGRIEGAAAWKDRQWQQTCGVSRREVEAAAKLLAWDGAALVVWNYPTAKQEEVKAKREAGRLGGAAKSNAKAEAVRLNGALGGRPPKAETKADTPAEPKQNLSTNLTEGKGREEEGNGKELNTSDGVPPPPDAFSLSSVSTEPAKEPPKRATRPRDPLFDALATSTGEQPEALTATAARSIGVALAEIRKASPDVTPEEIMRRAENYRLHMPQATLTANALKAHWGRCSVAPASRDTTLTFQRKTAEIDHSKGF